MRPPRNDKSGETDCGQGSLREGDPGKGCFVGRPGSTRTRGSVMRPPRNDRPELRHRHPTDCHCEAAQRPKQPFSEVIPKIPPIRIHCADQVKLLAAGTRLELLLAEDRTDGVPVHFVPNQLPGPIAPGKRSAEASAVLCNPAPQITGHTSIEHGADGVGEQVNEQAA